MRGGQGKSACEACSLLTYVHRCIGSRNATRQTMSTSTKMMYLSVYDRRDVDSGKLTSLSMYDRRNGTTQCMGGG